MVSRLSILASVLAVATAYPIRRDVTLDPAATAEAQQVDNTATRAFTAVQIQTGTGQCLSVDPNSGDFRENLTPVQILPCDATSANQTWDLITAGVHDNTPGQALIVSHLTNACMNFDPRRAAGDQVILFSCGGRADGGGTVTNSQQFAYTNGSTIPFIPANQANTCLVVNQNTNLLDVNDNCDTSNPGSVGTFTFGSGGAAASTGSSTTSSGSGDDTGDDCGDSSSSSAPAATSTSSSAVSSTTSIAAVATTTSVPASAVSSAANPHITDVTLDPAATAEAQQVDNTAVKAFSSSQIKTDDGRCLFVDQFSGDFRENLTPVQIVACDSTSAGQKWDLITSGVHQNTPGESLIVSSLTNACMNFDPRRAAGDQVILFSCGGRADGGGTVTNSQQFAFTAGESTLAFVPANQANTCLVVNDSTDLLDVNDNCDTSNPGTGGTFTFSG